MSETETKTEAGEEPSIEEILESIRQIISDDDEEEGQEEAIPKEEPADKEVEVDLAPKEEPADKEVEVDLAPKEEPADKEVEVDLAPKEEDDDVLDLTDEVNVEEPVEDKKMDKSSIDDIFDSEEPKKIEDAALEIPDDESSDDIISTTTADAATVALAKLLDVNVAVEREYDGRVGKLTLEDMTIEVMKPLIKLWLDQNLQDIIEKLVQKEVEKLSRRALDK